MRFAGNSLACTNCHLNAGLQPFSAPYVSTFATYPRMEMDTVETLTERINSCLTNSMNGRPLPPGGREMNALIAYIQYLGVGSPEGIRVPGMGLLPLPPAAETPDAARGAVVFTNICAKCHGANGAGQDAATSGYAIPPLWGDGSFNAAAGMNTIETASAFIRANMPRGITYTSPILTVQQAWDVAAYVLSQPRPPAPAGQ
jgi:thiosulfate dehydrogenase